MTGRSRALATLLASALVAGPALADPKPLSEKDRQLASDLVKKAIARSSAGDHSGAIEIYLQAYSIFPNSALLSNIGAEYQQSSMPKEALKYFCMYLEKEPSGTNAPYATSQAKILQRQLGNKKVDEHDVCAPPPPKPEPKTVTVTDEDEAPRSVKPRPKRPRSPGGDPVQPAPEAPPPSGNASLMYTGVGVGVAGIAAAGLGVYFGLQGKSISDELNNHDPKAEWPANVRDLQREGDRDNGLEIGFLVASGVLVTTGVVLYMVSRPDAPPERDRTAVRVVPTANGVAVLGRF